MRHSLFTQSALAGALFFSLVGPLSPAATAAAASGDTALLERVRLLEETIKGLQTELGAVKAEAQAAKETSQAAATQAAASQAVAEKAATEKAKGSGGKIEFKPSPTFTSEDGAFSFKVRGRFEADLGFYDVREGTRQFSNGTEIRRLRLGIEGTAFKDWFYRAEVDLAKGSRTDNTGNELDVKEAIIQYRGFANKNTRLTVGQHKTPNSLEQLTSSTQLTFLERATPVNAFTDRITAGGDFKSGVSASFGGEQWTATVGAFGENFAVTSSGITDEGWGGHARLTYAPILEKGRILHLGASGYLRKVGTNGSVRFRDRPEVTVDGTRLVDTGAILADDYNFLGAEVAGVWGPLFVQAEYLRTNVDRSAPGLSNVTFDGGYVTVSYLLTGETRGYRNGLISRVSPANPFSLSKGQWGAFELAGRFSTVDLNDDNIRGGKQDNFTLGLNWYFNQNFRTQFNWVRFDAERGIEVTKGDAFAVRFAVDW